MLRGETVHSPLPQDLTWFQADHAVFFGVLYIVLFVICAGMGYCILKSWVDSRNDCTHSH
jgi:hypothetical protein